MKAAALLLLLLAALALEGAGCGESVSPSLSLLVDAEDVGIGDSVSREEDFVEFREDSTRAWRDGAGGDSSSECLPGQKSCFNNLLIVCLPDGSGWKGGEACPVGTECKGGKCVEKPAVCTPGVAKCVGDGVATCLADGSGWGATVPCPDGTKCQYGKCVSSPVKDCQDVLTCMLVNSCGSPEPTCLEDCFSGASISVTAVALDLYDCMYAKCGKWGPGEPCFQQQRMSGCSGQFAECKKQCAPNCGGKNCGSDGCGGVCGECSAGVLCVNGVCQCEPDCAGKECGPDGCNGQCGQCAGNAACVNGTCHCVPDCDGKQCGPDGCGAECGICESNQCENGVCQQQQIGWTCAEIIGCVINQCKFGLQCSWNCYAQGSQSGQKTFESLAWCIAEKCGQNASETCALQALNGDCEDEYDKCLGL